MLCLPLNLAELWLSFLYYCCCCCAAAALDLYSTDFVSMCLPSYKTQRFSRRVSWCTVNCVAVGLSQRSFAFTSPSGTYYNFPLG